MCNTNERVVLSTSKGESLLSDINSVNESSESMFHLTCSGASLSKD